MHALVGIIKALCLCSLAVITLGWGACGALGLTISVSENNGDFQVLVLGLVGLALMVLFGWWTWKLFFVFFPKPPDDGRGGSASAP